MKELHETHSNFGVDNTGEIVPLEDFDEVPVANESIVQGMTNLETWRNEQDMVDKAEAEAKFAREQAVIDNGMQEAGVHVTLEQYYQDQLDLLDAVFGANSKGGFEKGGQFTPEAAERYKENLPRVVKGARKNRIRMVNHDVAKIYHAQDLVDSGIEDEAVILHDARTTVPSEVRSRYGGDANEKARAAHRKHLREKLAHYATK